MLLGFILAVLCGPFESPVIAGYLMPLIFILFTLAISRLTYALISLLWAASALLLLTYNYNFLNGVESGHSLSFILSVLISFAICLLYMSRIYQRSEWLKRGWQGRALTDPLTGLPNIRALEEYLEIHQMPKCAFCAWITSNFEPPLRDPDAGPLQTHDRLVAAAPSAKDEMLFQLPGSELVVVLLGPEIAERLQHMVDRLNSRKIFWNNTGLDIEFGASPGWSKTVKNCITRWGN